eukprot:11169480-Lingulodinium_polyedra.AAC.1
MTSRGKANGNRRPRRSGLCSCVSGSGSHACPGSKHKVADSRRRACCGRARRQGGKRPLAILQREAR